MKKELMLYVILAMVASSFLNAQITAKVDHQIASTKSRIEVAGKAYAKASEQKIQKVATQNNLEKPNEG